MITFIWGNMLKINTILSNTGCIRINTINARRICFVIFILIFSFNINKDNALALSENDAAPDFSLKSQFGKTVSLSDYQGKVVYLDFWASWCGPCRHTLPWMQKLQSKFKSQGLEVVAVNLDVHQADAEKLFSEINPSFTILFDPTGEAAKKYQLPSMPSSFLLDKKGRIVIAHSGFREGDDAILESDIETLLNSKR